MCTDCTSAARKSHLLQIQNLIVSVTQLQIFMKRKRNRQTETNKEDPAPHHLLEL